MTFLTATCTFLGDSVTLCYSVAAVTDPFAHRYTNVLRPMAMDLHNIHPCAPRCREACTIAIIYGTYYHDLLNTYIAVSFKVCILMSAGGGESLFMRS